MYNGLFGLSLLVLGIFLGIAVSVTAQIDIDEARAPNAFFTGDDWLGLTKTEQATYAMGVIDALDLAATLKPQGLYWINPCVTGMTSDQVRAMLREELDVRPGDRHLLMVHRAMYQALWKACRRIDEK